MCGADRIRVDRPTCCDSKVNEAPCGVRGVVSLLPWRAAHGAPDTGPPSIDPLAYQLCKAWSVVPPGRSAVGWPDVPLTRPPSRLILWYKRFACTMLPVLIRVSETFGCWVRRGSPQLAARFWPPLRQHSIKSDCIRLRVHCMAFHGCSCLSG